MEKVSVFIKSLFLSFLFFIKNKIYKNNANFGSNGILISMTTYSKRIDSVYLTIESLFSQKLMPDRVVLWLCKDDIPDGLPKSLKRLECRGLEIKIINKNLRSYKKLSFLCENMSSFSFDCVVTADDDVFYPSYWLEKMYQKFLLDSNSVHCYRGKVISFDGNEVAPYQTWPTTVSVCNSNPKRLMPTGVSGVCYPKSALSEEFHDWEGILNYCKYADDIWYKISSLRAGYGAKLVLDNNIHFTPVIFSLAKGLEVYNVDENLNVTQFNRTMKYRNLSKSFFF